MTGTTLITIPTMTTSYLDPVTTYPSTGSFIVSHYTSTRGWASCNTYIHALYISDSSPGTDCADLLFWDTACTSNAWSSIYTLSSLTHAFKITAKAPSTNTLTTVSTTCTLAIDWYSTSTGTLIGFTDITFVLNRIPCNAHTLAWSTASYTIPSLTYYVSETALTTPASLATQTNACGYTVTYELLNGPTVATAADNTVFTLTPSSTSPSSISIYTTNTAKFGTYPLLYRARITNARDGTTVKIDASFTVTVDRCK